MARGNRCPSCGELTFQKRKHGAYRCSSCKAVGWLKRPNGPGEGKGKECPRCHEPRSRQIYRSLLAGIAIRFCYSCDSVSMKFFKRPGELRRRLK